MGKAKPFKYVLQTGLPVELRDKFGSFTGIIWFVCYTSIPKGEWLGVGGLQLNRVPYLGPSFVKPSARGQGIQRMLIEARERWCLENGYKVLTSRADISNIYSRNNLEACGFKETGRSKEEVFYEKTLGETYEIQTSNPRPAG